jgi:hypothetical protein
MRIKSNIFQILNTNFSSYNRFVLEAILPENINLAM